MLFPRSDTCQEASSSGLWPRIWVSVKAAEGPGRACPGAEARGGFLVTSLSTCGQHPGPQGWQHRVASGPHWPTKDKLTTARETAGDTPEHAPPWEVQSTEQTSWDRPFQAPQPRAGLLSRLNLLAPGTGPSYGPDLPTPGPRRRKRFWRTWMAHPSRQPGRVLTTPLRAPVSSGASPGPHCLQAPPRDSTHPGMAGLRAALEIEQETSGERSQFSHETL